MSEHRDVIVIGGGQAGLAIGYHLARQRLDFSILESADVPAAAWRERWDSLRLFTPVRYDSLPARQFPGPPSAHPTRDQVVEYLTDYARAFALPVELGSRVHSLRAGPSGYVVALEDRTYEADQVVIATGPFQVPRIPAIAGSLDPAVRSLHSTGYRRPADIPPGRVLVVGGGNTGFQIAADLADSHEVHLAIGSHQTPLPQRVLGRDLFQWAAAIGFMSKTADTRIGRRAQKDDTLIGSSPRGLRRRGVGLVGRAIGARGSTVGFQDGSRLAVETVVWATGFGLDHSWVHLPVFGRDGVPVHRRGVTVAPGVYFLGLPFLHTRGSALLGWVKDDAEYIAEQIRLTRTRTGGRVPPRRVLQPTSAAPPT